MKNIKVVGISSIIFLNACTPNIIDRDFEAEEAAYINKYKEFAKNDPLWQSPTPDNMFLTEVDGVTVTIHKKDPDDNEGIMLQNWSVVVTNHNKIPKCVNIVWKLQGFKIVNDDPGFNFFRRNEAKFDYVKLKQLIWDMDGLRIALPPSGYIYDMDVKNPNFNNKYNSDICDFFVEEDDIIER